MSDIAEVIPPADASGAAGDWRFTAASVVGVSHVRDGLPCQDAHRCEVAIGPGGPVLVAVVSDGAGSASEGGRGAAYICEQLCEQVQLRLAEFSPATAIDVLWDSVASTRDGLLAKAERLGLSARQLAATLLCAVLAEDCSAFAQIGDGAIVTPETGTDMWSWLFWPQRGEYANTTSFVTDPTAMESLQVDAIPHAQFEVALFTDGIQHLVLNYEKQTVHSPFFERMMGPVRRSTASGDDPTLSAQLETYLGSPTVTSRADDDLTLVMASRVVVGPDVASTR
jgi:Protein phosphatase 2C